MLGGKVLVIGVSDRPNSITRRSILAPFTLTTRVMGAMLNAAFIDSPEVDVERPAPY